MTTAEQNFKNANIYAHKGQYAKAIKELDKAIKKKKRFRRALFNRAVFKTNIKDFNGAIEDYKAITGFTNCTECFYEVAVILNNEQRYEKAIEVLNSALKTKGIVKHSDIFKPNIQFLTNDSDSDYNVNEENIYFERGFSYLKSKKFEKAINDFKKTNDFDFYKNEGYYYIGEAFLGLKDYSNACINFNKSAKLGLEKAEEMLEKHCVKKRNK
ncbi:tetratricopeptide repeat protein [Tenacibaculum sp. MEBiC06402]|uniref:tetratricopeptide repeat protein n=1 Tax=unclassified Tenacibaculum TaxID=2635139 RepID=UPI003B9AE634